MKITVFQLRKIISEVIVSRFDAQIHQNRDEFSDMMSNGTYYDDMGWPSEEDDSNCDMQTFSSANDAISWAQSRLLALKDNDIDYRALIYTFGPRGKRILVKELT